MIRYGTEEEEFCRQIISLAEVLLHHKQDVSSMIREYSRQMEELANDADL
jgi:hypothetical protein